MTRKKNKKTVSELKAIIGQDDDLGRGIVQMAVQEFLEAEMNEALGTTKSERSDGRLGYRSGHDPRKRIPRAGTVERRVPQDRQGRFSTEIFSRYQRQETALVSALLEMDVHRVFRLAKSRPSARSFAATS
jgi:transposase-like protein